MKWDYHEIADVLLDQALPAAAVGIAAFLVGRFAYNRLAQEGLFGSIRQANARKAAKK